MSNRFGYCGMDCSKCPVYLATINNNDDSKKEIAEEWSKTYKEFLEKDMKSEDIHCLGCKIKNQHLFIGCQICDIRKCCSVKGLESCRECVNFDTCEIIQGFLSFHEKTP